MLVVGAPNSASARHALESGLEPDRLPCPQRSARGDHRRFRRGAVAAPQGRCELLGGEDHGCHCVREPREQHLRARGKTRLIIVLRVGVARACDETIALGLGGS